MADGDENGYTRHDDLTLLANTLEQLLTSSADPADEKFLELKSKAEQSLEEVKSRISQASGSCYCRARQVISCADSYIHQKPWHGMGMGAAVGMVLGLLLARR